jgi:predicted TIM-barrel fold metal-dependent hydrolase
MRSALVAATLAALLLSLAISPGGAQNRRGAVIDVHLHAQKLDAFIASQTDKRWFPNALRRPGSDDDLMRESLAALVRNNVVRAVTSEEFANVERWRQASPDRIIPAFQCVPCATDKEFTAVRKLAAEGRIKVIGELVWQYHGLSASDPRLDPLWALAEEFDLPMLIHCGPTPTGWSQTVDHDIRIRNGSALLLEDALVLHPKARVYIAHAGWPFADDTVAMLYQYPNLYVDVSWIDWYLPRAEFHGFLKRLVDAGFANRIMFGSDQMQWPETIGQGIEGIESAPFLSAGQKRAILCGNAARFLRLDSKICG